MPRMQSKSSTPITAWRSTGATAFIPWYLSNLARAYAELGQFDDAWRRIGEAMTTVETTKERWWEAEVNRVAGEIALLSPEPDAAKAEQYFEHALSVARAQQAKSRELRVAMSMAKLWRDSRNLKRLPLCRLTQLCAGYLNPRPYFPRL
jgi:predicted ATPase